jgi:hypothetical protein
MNINPAAIETLVDLTLDRERREQLQELRQGAPDAAAMKALVNSSYPAQTDDFAATAPYYCDRVMAGIDDWNPGDQDKWIDVCQILTELTSSVAG